jgi:hypothetical protein
LHLLPVGEGGKGRGAQAAERGFYRLRSFLFMKGRLRELCELVVPFGRAAI